jgi:hypothetical protein
MPLLQAKGQISGCEIPEDVNGHEEGSTKKQNVRNVATQQ